MKNVKSRSAGRPRTPDTIDGFGFDGGSEQVKASSADVVAIPGIRPTSDYYLWTELKPTAVAP